MDNIKVLFGTPEPIMYTEIDLEYGLDLYVLCRINGSVLVTGYPEEYADESVLRDQVKDTSLQELKECLQNIHESCSGKMFYTSEDRDAVLGKAIEEALIKKEIRSEVSIAHFTLSSDSISEIDRYKKEYIENHGCPVMHIDIAYKNEECFDRNNYRDPNSFSKSEEMGFMMQKPVSDVSQTGEWICPNCKTNGNKGNFCTECGTRRP